MTGKQETDPLPRFNAWFEEAKTSEISDPEAMSLSTANAEGHPSSRMVLLKGVDSDGFVFYTNTESHKGEELAANPHAALLFHWKSLRRQVRVEGPVSTVSDREADDYFANRPRSSRIGAWASDQSRPMEGMLALERRVARFAAKFGLGEIPRPPHWSGYRIAPRRIEFWKEGRFRMHERVIHIRDGDGWRVELLFP